MSPKNTEEWIPTEHPNKKFEGVQGFSNWEVYISQPRAGLSLTGVVL
jgi:hypothetical protein